MPRCLYCGIALNDCRRCCDACAHELCSAGAAPALTTEINGLQICALGGYARWLRRLILSQKTAPAGPVVRWLATELDAKAPAEWKQMNLAWIPGRPFEGMHLVEALALELAALGWRLTPRTNLVRRATLAKPQKALDLNARKQRRISDVYRAVGRRASDASEPVDVVLLDDVITTGATISGAAEIMRERLGYRVRGALSLAYTKKENKSVVEH